MVTDTTPTRAQGGLVRCESCPRSGPCSCLARAQGIWRERAAASSKATVQGNEEEELIKRRAEEQTQAHLSSLFGVDKTFAQVLLLAPLTVVAQWLFDMQLACPPCCCHHCLAIAIALTCLMFLTFSHAHCMLVGDDGATSSRPPTI